MRRMVEGTLDQPPRRKDRARTLMLPVTIPQNDSESGQWVESIIIMTNDLGRLEIESRAMRWLTDVGVPETPAVKSQLLAQLLSSPGAIVMGAITGLIVSVASLARDGSTVFFVLIVVELILLALRTTVILHIRASHAAGRPARMDAAIALSCIWCSTQGIAAFFAMGTGDQVLMVLSATLIMALIGPLCARNYAAPRLAFLLVCLCDFPFVAGALSTGNPWYLCILIMTPPFLFGAMQIVANYRSTMVRALEAENQNLMKSRRDPLTRLLNRSGLDAELAGFEAEQGLAIIAMDLDGFKEINDTHGHAAGDAILQMVAARMSNIVNEPRILARLGGDEFIAVLPDATPSEVKNVANHLLCTVRDEVYRVEGLPAVKIGVSVGYACAPQDAKTVEQLRMFADQALYAAKGAGKGRSARFGVDIAA